MQIKLKFKIILSLLLIALPLNLLATVKVVYLIERKDQTAPQADSFENLLKNCQIILLKASLDEIYIRTLKNGKETRPIIDKEDPKKEIEKVLNLRKPYYMAAAEIIIDTTNRNIENIVREIAIKTHLKT